MRPEKKLEDRLQMQVKRVQYYGIKQMSSNGRVNWLIDSKMFKKVSFKSVFWFEPKPNLILVLTQA